MAPINKDGYVEFPGFKPKYKSNFFTYPTVLEKYFCYLSGSEQKVLDFVIRMTLGFQKTSDEIALSQFVTGVKGLNRGAGVSRSQAQRALKSLKEKGFITITPQKFKQSIIALKLESEKNDGLGDSKSNSVTKVNENVLRLIRAFEPVAGHRVEEYLNSQKQIDAICKLIEYYGEDFVEKIIVSLAQVQNEDTYAPTITSPIELGRKLPSLRASIKRISNKSTDML